MKLKPCPFCGSIAIMNAGEEGGYWVSCFDCPAELGEAYGNSASKAIGICTFGEFETKEEAARAWNRRMNESH